MRNARLALIAACVGFVAEPAYAGDRWPVVPPEIGVAPIVGPVFTDYRCHDGAYNFYHGAFYGEEPPALHRGYAYRPYYRYTAYRRLPRTYVCVSDE